MKEIINRYFREDNRKTWLSMLGSLVGFFLPELINAIWTTNRIAYWLLFIASLLCLFLFLAMAFQYVNRWHNIINTLRSKNASLYKTVSLYAVLSKSEAAHHVNEAIAVRSVDVVYQFYPAKYSGNNFTTYFPFTVTYTIQGTVQKPFSTLYFHLLGHKSNEKIELMDVQINGIPSKPRKEDDQGNVQVVSFAHHNTLQPGGKCTFTISIPFDKASGLAQNRTQTFLLYPKNISCHYTHDAIARVGLVYLNNLRLEDKYNIRLIKYLDGLYEDPQYGRFEPQRRQHNSGNTVLYWTQPLYDNANSIYLVEFTGGKQ